MTIDDFKAKLTLIKNDLSGDGRGVEFVMRSACFGTLAQVKQRIHEQGEAVDGEIGQYNKTNPIYVNPEDSPVSFTPTGKGQKRAKKVTVSNIATRSEKRISVKQGNRPRETKYFESYDDYKTFIGRNQANKVNLFLFGGLANNFTVIAAGNGFGLGWTPGSESASPEGKKPLTISYFLRAKYLELKYGKTIWGLTDAEKKTAIESGQIALNEYIKENFK